MSLFEGKYAVVTGAGGGIGSATAAGLVHEGAAGVLLVDRDADALERAAATVAAAGAGAKVLTQTADVTSEADVQAYVERALDEFGRIDGFFNNAGIEGSITTLVDTTAEQFDEIIAINLRGIFLGLKHVIPPMVRQGGGAIVNTGSIAAARGLVNSAGYVAAKHGTLGLTRVAAAEHAADNVRVNCVLPGMIDTRMLRSIATTLAGGDTEGGVAAAAGTAPIKRTGSADEVASVVVFLLSDGASFVHGADWSVDGGILGTTGNQ